MIDKAKIYFENKKGETMEKEITPRFGHIQVAHLKPELENGFTVVKIERRKD